MGERHQEGTEEQHRTDYRHLIKHPDHASKTADAGSPKCIRIKHKPRAGLTKSIPFNVYIDIWQ